MSIDEFWNDLAKDKKVTTAFSQKGMLFLPDMMSVLQLINPNITPPSLLKSTFRQLDKPLPISNTSLTNLYSDKGVGLKSARAFYSSMFETFPHLEEFTKKGYQNYPTGIENIDSTPDWEAVVYGLDDNVWSVAQHFLMERVKCEREALQNRRRSIELKCSEKEVGNAYFGAIFPQIQLSKNEQDIFLEGVLSLVKGKKISVQTSEVILNVYLDFYFSLLACMDTEVLYYLNQNHVEHGLPGGESSTWPKHGIFFEIIQLSDHGNFFNGFLSYIKKLAKIKTERELCQHVSVKLHSLETDSAVDTEINERDSAEKLLEAQRSALKEWRKQKTGVSNEKLELFIESITDGDFMDLSTYGYISQILARLYSKLKAEPALSDEVLERLFSEERYKIYFKHIKRKATENNWF
ncbi:hypothetical protein BCU61_024080 [Vibrio splendidus]|uniref:hypothetical protein n=2 Tax=Vibrio splendidus TaxID=29497 RepID=UPI000C829307|nr:hypothetical protein [Vibrio splendidus]PMH71206.1 hypothetical protein BCU61_06150 [Vibrio splendidus]PMJ26787.1 hypothetical protein BCU26_20880 [Vibrio splendidus]